MSDNRIQIIYEGIKRKINEYDALKADMDKFLVDIDKRLSEKQAQFSQEQHNHKKLSLEIESINGGLRKDLTSLSQERLALQRKIDDSITKLESLQSMVSSMLQEKNRLLQLKEEANAEFERLSVSLERRKEALNSSEDAYEERMMGFLGDAVKMELFSGLRLEPVGENRLQFIFFNLDPNDFDRKFSIIVNVEGVNYSVEETLPLLSLDFVDKALLELNQDQQLASFLRKVENQFKLLISLQD